MRNISKDRAAEIDRAYANVSTEKLFEGLLQEFPEGRIALLSSFGAEAAILLYYAAQIDKNFPIIFLNTQKLFKETLEYRDMLVEKLDLKNVKNIYPDYVDISRNDPEGTLWDSSPRRCCTIRKVIPLERALKGYDAWITGRKRYHGGIRTDLPFAELADGRIKINPLVNWTREDIDNFFKEKNLPPHPLTSEGYSSIGCTHCTAKPIDKNNPRSGRWAGQGKEECGIHLEEDGKFIPNKTLIKN